MSEQSTAEQNVARSAIELQIQLDNIQKKLNEQKEELRSMANGHKKEIIVEGVGKVNISTPFGGKESKILIFNEEKLDKFPELKSKLIEKGVAKEELKKTPASVAKVTIKPNV